MVENWIDLILNIRIQDIVDILLISMIIYRILSFVRETRAEQLMKGVGLLLVLTKISEILRLYAVNWLLSNTVTMGAFAIIVVFQPELRRGLEYLGRSSIIPNNLLEYERSVMSPTIESISSAVQSLSRQQIGALIIVEGKTGLGDIIETGVEIGGLISTDLLISIFIPSSPLHDGAVIVRGDKVMAAGTFLPLSQDRSLSSEMGTRHKAALGISERSDVLSIVVSEETGTISVAENGKMSRHLDIETLEAILNERFIDYNTTRGFKSIWRS